MNTEISGLFMWYNTRNAIKNHVGVSLVHEFENHIDGLCTRPLYPEISNGSVLAWKKTQVFPAAVARLIEHIKKCTFTTPCELT